MAKHPPNSPRATKRASSPLVESAKRSTDHEAGASSPTPASVAASAAAKMLMSTESDERYEQHDVELGEGYFSTVFRGIKLSNNAQIAIKVPHQEGSPRYAVNGLEVGEAQKQIEKERSVMELLQMGGVRPYLSQLMDVVQDEESPYGDIKLILLKCGPNLGDWLEERGHRPPCGVKAEITRQIYCGLKTLHDRGVSHRDLHLKNILVHKGEGCIKISDFGSSILKTEVPQRWEHLLRSELYSATSHLIATLWLGRCVAARPKEARNQCAARGIEQADIETVVHALYTRCTDMAWYPTHHVKYPWEKLFEGQAHLLQILKDLFAWEFSTNLDQTLGGIPVPSRFLPPLMVGRLLGPIAQLTASNVFSMFDDQCADDLCHAAALYIRSGQSNPILEEN